MTTPNGRTWMDTDTTGDADIRAWLERIGEEYTMNPALAEYALWDQEKHLGPPPWRNDDLKLWAWEEAHGHDVRSKCYAEFGCRLVEEQAARDVGFLLLGIETALTVLAAQRGRVCAVRDTLARMENSGPSVNVGGYRYARKLLDRALVSDGGES